METEIRNNLNMISKKLAYISFEELKSVNEKIEYIVRNSIADIQLMDHMQEPWQTEEMKIP